MSAACRQDNCTVGETGTCLLNNDPTTCPHRVTTEGKGSLDVAAEVAPLHEPARNPSFPLSLTLTPALVRELMATRYCLLIGILGAPDAGKTAALVSLYLLLARNHLPGFSFADSRSLMAFDEISHGARRWNEGKLPDQLTAHTQMKDDRSAGFLHLRLKPDGLEPVDLLLPDLPGEWTTALVDNGRADRLSFLKGADVIWLMVDGRQLSQAHTRQWAMHRTKLLMQRLASLLAPSVPMILVVTRRDQATTDRGTLDELSSEAAVLRLNISIVEIASFAGQGGVAPGTGIRDLVQASIRPANVAPAFWPESAAGIREERAIMRFRRAAS